MNDQQTVATRPCIVGIGASAGGLEAIREMLSASRAEANMAFVVIQHLDPNHESLLAELLARFTPFKVLQASGGEKVEAGNVYIIPPGHGLSIGDGILQLTDFARPRGLRRPIDDFFESLAADQGRFAACVILSGTGADGSAGLRAIKENGGLCIAQDPDTARYDGMPLSAIQTGLIDFIQPPERIIDCISRFHSHDALADNGSRLAETVEKLLPEICSVLHRTVGHDFSGYKVSTLHRRVERRIQVLNVRNASEYLERLRRERSECETLFRELLINVTRFFRDAEHFEKLRIHVAEPLVREAGDREIRIWVSGCSSGEEAFSIAMLFADEVRRQGKSILIQIFATDIDEQMLRIARQAIYPLSALIDIPEPMREAYTIPREGAFQINSRIRDMVRFSSHSVLKDPPFSNIDLISCRNLLIYFGDRLQATTLAVFQYALRAGGALFLGPSETIGRFDDIFSVTEQRARLYRRNDGLPNYPVNLRSMTNRDREADRGEAREVLAGRTGGNRDAATERLLRAHAPASLTLTRRGEILSSTGQLAKYIEVRPDRGGVRHAQALVRPGLRKALSALLRTTAESRRPGVARDLTARSEFGRQGVDLICEPLTDGTFLVVFRDTDRFRPTEDDALEELAPSESHIQDLEEELRSTRSRLHIAVEELETANEELKSSNEEMMSMNEELQSTNEELSTVNDELKSKVDQLSVANADLQNFFASTALPLVVVDGRMRVRNFTEAILTIYPLRSGDRGRPLPEVTSVLKNHGEVLDAAQSVIETGQIWRGQAQQVDGVRTWSLMITPYQGPDSSRSGATLVFTDITESLKLEETLAEEGQRLRLALGVAQLGVWDYSPDTGRLNVDEIQRRLVRGRIGSKTSLKALLGTIAPEDRARVEGAIEEATRSDQGLDVTFRLDVPGIVPRVLQMVGKNVGTRGAAYLLGVTFEVTDEHEAARTRELMLREMNHRVKNLFSIISGMLRIVGRTSYSIPELIDGMERRIGALANSHDMTQRGAKGAQATLRDAVQAAVSPYNIEGRVSVHGPQVLLDGRALTSMTLLLHEWATNAAKYGVLGPLDGRLEVTWSVAGDRIELKWNETYDAALESSVNISNGFGSTLVALSAAQLGGDVTVDAAAGYRNATLNYARSATTP